MPGFLYVFSDRTVASWDPSRLGDLQAQRDRLPAPGVTQLFIDVGVEKPVDAAITNVEVNPQSVPANREVVMKATVTATGQACDGEVQCRLVGETAVERQPVKLEAGQTAIVEFKRKNLAMGQYQAEIKLVPQDALPSDHLRFVTLQAPGARPAPAPSDPEDDPLLSTTRPH